MNKVLLYTEYRLYDEFHTKFTKPQRMSIIQKSLQQLISTEIFNMSLVYDLWIKYRQDHNLIGWRPDQVFNMKEQYIQFKLEWDIGSKETNKMLDEMISIAMSKDLDHEWRLMHNNKRPNGYHNVLGKSKFELWESFKEMWKLNIFNYNEDVFKNKQKVINDCLINDTFQEYLTDSNYHSFDTYSVLEQYSVCSDFLLS
jgi:hypothetical protein